MNFPDWIISDTHFGHANIYKYCQRCTPSLPTQEHVERAMEANWSRLVRPSDTILHLGDVAFKGYDLDMLELLPGHKHWLRGNHDNHIKEIPGWTEIEALELEIDGGRALFTHYPQQLRQPKLVNIHGHTHNNPYEATPRHINLSVECWNYAPVSGRVIREKAEWTLKSKHQADYGPRTVRRK